MRCGTFASLSTAIVDLPQLLEARNGGLQCCRNDSVQSLAARVRFLHSRRADRTRSLLPLLRLDHDRQRCGRQCCGRRRGRWLGWGWFVPLALGLERRHGFVIAGAINLVVLLRTEEL